MQKVLYLNLLLTIRNTEEGGLKRIFKHPIETCVQSLINCILKIIMPRPRQSEYTSFFSNYINLTNGNHYKDLVNNHNKIICDYWTHIPDEKWEYSYADGKWTIKQLFQHVIDTERILAFRALSIARKEPSPLSSFDENEYAKNGNATDRDPLSMINEFRFLRKSTNYLYSSFNDQEKILSGKVVDKTISVNALGFIINGRSLHNINICKKYYGL